MSRKHTNKDTRIEAPVDSLTNESARQRWDLFHRAIAHAKQCNDAEMRKTDTCTGDDEGAGPAISVVRR